VVTRVPIPAALLCAALLLPAGPVAGDEAPAPPRYALPEGWAPARPLAGDLQAAAARAVTGMTTPSDPFAAREGWRVLAGLGPGAAPAAVEALGKATWFGRALLVRALGSMEDPGLVPVLVEAARDPAWAVREAGAEGLGLSEGAIPAGLLPRLLADPSWRVRAAAVEATRSRALRGALPRDDAARSLLPLAADDDADVRRAALLALADLRSPAGRPILLEALRALGPKVQGTEGDQPEEPELRTATRLLRGLAAGAGDDPAVLAYLWGEGADRYDPWHPLAGPRMREWFRLRGDEGLKTGGALDRLVEIFLYRGGTDADSHLAAEEALLDLGDPAADALLDKVCTPERATRATLPYALGRPALELVLRVRTDRAPEILARILRDGRLTYLLRMHAANLGRRACPAALGPVFREVFEAEKGEGGLAANLLHGIAASGGDDVAGRVARALVRNEPDGSPPEVRVAAAEVCEARPALRDAAAIRRAVAVERDADVLEKILPLAAGVLGPDGPAAVAPFLRDPRMRVRRAAVAALERAPGATSTRMLTDLLATEAGDDDRLPWYGPKGPDAQQKEEIAEIRRANAGSVKEAAVTTLRFAAGAEAPALLRGLLDDGDPFVRDAAARNLVTLGDDGAADALAKRIAREEDPGLRDRFLTSLAAIGGGRADEAFEGFLAGDDEALRQSALEALAGESARARAPRGARLRLEDREAGPSERLSAIPALGRGGGPGAVEILGGILLATKEGEERRAALQALGMTRDPAAVKTVAALLPSGDVEPLDPDGRETVDLAIETLGELRAEAAAAPLASLLARALPRALAGGGGAEGARARQRASLCIGALGKCGGPTALDALTAAAFHPGFSRAAEAATADPLRLRPPRREDERWRPRLPDEIRDLGTGLAVSLSRWKDADLVPALQRRLAALAPDGRVYALAEEWILWLAEALGTPPERLPNRPRWFSKVLLLRQALVNPPRLSEADAAAARDLFVHESQVASEYGAAGRALGAWRTALRVQDPVQADRDERLMEELGAVVVAAEALRRGGDLAAAAKEFEAAFEAGRRDRVARLVVDVLTDLRKDPALAVRYGELAVRADGSYGPNFQSLGEARLAAEDLAGAAEALAAAAVELDRGSREPTRSSARARGILGRTLFLLGREEEALRALAAAAYHNDTVLEGIDRDRALEPLRKSGRLEEALEPARKRFE
jgi:HEAT repeat protein/tetratricopeptide (TPR) repeat protein